MGPVDFTDAFMALLIIGILIGLALALGVPLLLDITGGTWAHAACAGAGMLVGGWAALRLSRS